MEQLDFNLTSHNQAPLDPRVEELLNGFEGAAFDWFIKVDHNPASGLKKVRKLHKPNDEMYRAHEIIKALAVTTGAISPNATGSLAGSSSRANIEKHIGHQYFYLVDLKNAFEQIRMSALAAILARQDFPASEADIETILERYCRKPDGRGLCIGGPASPVLFNIALFDTDNLLAEMCDNYGVTYTRYVDDLTFSSNELIGQKKRRNFRDVLDQAGLVINHKKSHVHDLTVAPVVITGIQINRSGFCQLTTEYQARLNASIDELWSQVFQDGIALSDEQLSQLGGYKGSIMPSIDSRRPEMTEFERTILEKIEALRLSKRTKGQITNIGQAATLGYDGEPLDMMLIGRRTYRILGPDTIS